MSHEILITKPFWQAIKKYLTLHCWNSCNTSQKFGVSKFCFDFSERNE